MNKRNLKIFAALSLSFSVTRVEATINAFTTPVPLERAYAYSHYPFARPDYGECKRWFIDVWGAGLYKSANFAFLDKDTAKKESLAGIFFGADSFTIAQAFVPGSFNGTNLALLNIFTITPNFDYRESTAFFGANIETVFGCENQWHVGIRTRVPFRDIKVALDSCCALENNNITNFAVTQNEVNFDEDFDGTNQDTSEGYIRDAFAYRLDFLSQLPLAANIANNSANLFVQYSDVFNNTNISMGFINVTDLNTGNAECPVHVIARTSGTPPLYPQVPYFSLRGSAEVDGAGIGSVNGDDDNTPAAPSPLPFLADDGSGLANNARARFSDATDYTPLGASMANQSKLWVVPTLQGLVVDNNFDLAADARNIQSRVNALLGQMAMSSVDVLAANGITFDTQRNNGIGDFDIELYGRYDGCTCCLGSWFTEGIFGALFPTSKRISDPNKLLKVQTGNNHHYEIKLGWFLGWNPCDWFAVKTDLWYHWALRAKESVAAPFAGATVKNIGPTIDANVSWQYFVGEVDFTFIIPCIEPLIGFDVGYQAWVKRKDHVKLPVTSATDFLGIVQPLNASLLQARTKRIAHTVKAEIFKQTCDWQLFAGWNHTFAGKNSLNDSDWYLGLEVYF